MTCRFFRFSGRTETHRREARIRRDGRTQTRRTQAPMGRHWAHHRGQGRTSIRCQQTRGVWAEYRWCGWMDQWDPIADHHRRYGPWFDHGQSAGAETERKCTTAGIFPMIVKVLIMKFEKCKYPGYIKWSWQISLFVFTDASSDQEQ